MHKLHLLHPLKSQKIEVRIPAQIVQRTDDKVEILLGKQFFCLIRTRVRLAELNSTQDFQPAGKVGFQPFNRRMNRTGGIRRVNSVEHIVDVTVISQRDCTQPSRNRRVRDRLRLARTVGGTVK